MTCIDEYYYGWYIDHRSVIRFNVKYYSNSHSIKYNVIIYEILLRRTLFLFEISWSLVMPTITRNVNYFYIVNALKN